MSALAKGVQCHQKSEKVHAQYLISFLLLFFERYDEKLVVAGVVVVAEAAILKVPIRVKI